MKKQHVYSFAQGDGQDKKLLGGKGANLCEMTQIGINVPPGFVITTEACLDYLERNALPDSLMASVKEEIGNLEADTGKTFGTGSDPLLVSVRSGSAMSMPGMMDTILNLGLNQKTLASLIAKTGDERFAYDAYRRFIQLFGKVALGIEDEKFDVHFEAIKKRVGVKADVGLDAGHLSSPAGVATLAGNAVSPGSTPTAMANMSAVAQRYGASHLAFIIVPLVCAFFIDLVNALLIPFFLANF